MTTEEHDWFIDFYCKLSKHCEVTVSEAHCTTASSLSLIPVGDDLQHIECRRFCAYNFPVRLHVHGVLNVGSAILVYFTIVHFKIPMLMPSMFTSNVSIYSDRQWYYL